MEQKMEVLTEQDVNMINRILEAVVNKNTIVINSAVEICGNNKAKAIELLSLLCSDECLKPSIPMRGRQWNKTDTTEETLITNKYKKLRLRQLKKSERHGLETEKIKLEIEALKKQNRHIKPAFWIGIISAVIAFISAFL
ncbi:MAG: hypothetical protein LBV47_08980 [Bacteroidales bacterium]|jgi:hypothetical protein|nr:hypothetical protein [Bacteroidales bacterium]